MNDINITANKDERAETDFTSHAYICMYGRLLPARTHPTSQPQPPICSIAPRRPLSSRRPSDLSWNDVHIRNLSSPGRAFRHKFLFVPRERSDDDHYFARPRLTAPTSDRSRRVGAVPRADRVESAQCHGQMGSAIVCVHYSCCRRAPSPCWLEAFSSKDIFYWTL